MAQNSRKSYEKRLAQTTNPLLKKLFSIIIEKKSNLCVATNFKSFEETLMFINIAGPHICMLKSQTDSFGISEVYFKILYEKKKQFNFLLFEDLKFTDLPHAVGQRYRGYVKYVDIVTLFPFSDDSFNALDRVVKEAKLPEDEPRGCFALCEFSFSLWNQEVKQYHAKQNLELAERNTPICCGIIGQKSTLDNDCNMIMATPGVNICQTTDGMGQNWNHPSKVVGNGADIIIVGRGIVSAPESELLKRTINYKEICYQAYLDDLKAIN